MWKCRVTLKHLGLEILEEFLSFPFFRLAILRDLLYDFQWSQQKYAVTYSSYGFLILQPCTGVPHTLFSHSFLGTNSHKTKFIQVLVPGSDESKPPDVYTWGCGFCCCCLFYKTELWYRKRWQHDSLIYYFYGNSS